MREFWHMADDLIDQAFRVDSLRVDQLLADWRWLCPEPISLVARNAFGDLFLLNPDGKVLWLQVATGELTEIAASLSQFLDLLRLEEKREVWLAETDTRAAAERGLQPSMTQCVGFKIPIVFSESRDVSDNAYVADLYEQVSLLGDLHRQIASTADGAKVEIRIKR
jgi:hypothetical protein